MTKKPCRVAQRFLVLLFAVLGLGTTNTKAQLAGDNPSVDYIVAKILSSGGSASGDYTEYATRLSKTISTLSPNQQYIVFGYLPDVSTTPQGGGNQHPPRSPLETVDVGVSGDLSIINYPELPPLEFDGNDAIPVDIDGTIVLESSANGTVAVAGDRGNNNLEPFEFEGFGDVIDLDGDSPLESSVTNAPPPKVDSVPGGKEDDGRGRGRGHDDDDDDRGDDDDDDDGDDDDDDD